MKAKLEKASRGDAAAYHRLGKDLGKDTLDKRFVWKDREIEEICKDHQSLALELEKSLNKRVMSVTSDSSLSILEVFDAAALVILRCGVFLRRVK